MKAFHVNSTQPSRSYDVNGQGGKKSEYIIEDFDILTTILSALKWRQHNGSIKMYTDKIGKEYYDKIGISHIWDRGIDVDVLESADNNINANVFWAFGRIFVLRKLHFA